MSFEIEYSRIKNTVKDDLNFLEQGIEKIFTNKNPLEQDLAQYLTAPAKRLRPLLGILFLKCLFNEIKPAQRDVLLAVELIHNATLIHDDVIDKADKRRNQEALNKKFDDNLAVVAGDFLLSVAMEKVISAGSIEVIKVFTSALKTTCLGEINQYFSKFNITSIDKYIEKSKEKTAFLFQMAVLGALMVDENVSEDLKQVAIDFSQNFGIAFQIRDDLRNVLNFNSSSSDINSGIYTAPVIFAYEENKNILKEDDVQSALKMTQGIEKAKDLMDNYFNKSLSAIEKFEKSVYKESIVELIGLLRVNL